MCGRYTLAKPPREVRDVFAFEGDGDLLEPRYNIAPTQSAPVLLPDHSLVAYRWGLVPSWAEDESVGNRMINARSETVHVKPAFRRLLARRRCLVLADGFYEWQTLPRGKQPHLFQLRSRSVFAFAGLWDAWKRPIGEELRTFTILTTRANALLQRFHDRMPVILLPETAQRWLGEEDSAALADLFEPLSPDLMESHPVSTLVNSPRIDDPRCAAPLASPSSGVTEPTPPIEPHQAELF